MLSIEEGQETHVKCTEIFITQKYEKKSQNKRDAYQKKRHIQNNN